MKKLLVLLMVLGLVVTGCSTSERETLKVYNWGEYIDETVITEFEELYNVRVIYDLFESNEMMYTNLLGGEVYDVMIPSDYMIERLIAEGRIQKLDFTKLPNYAGVMENLKGLDFDPNEEYSAPYFWAMSVWCTIPKRFLKKIWKQVGLYLRIRSTKGVFTSMIRNEMRL
jgi:spermidine/putrescine-binding protein